MSRRKNPDFTLEVTKWLNSLRDSLRGVSRWDRVAARIDDLVYDQLGEPDGLGIHDLGKGLRALTTMPDGTKHPATALTYYVHSVPNQGAVIVFLTVCKGFTGDELSIRSMSKARNLMEKVKANGNDPSRY